jgi:hypothetical protein
VAASPSVSPSVNADDPAIAKSRLEAKIAEDKQKLEPKLKQGKTQKYSDKTYTYTAELTDTEYDIKKTDSIVTPYTGIVKYNLTWIAEGDRLPGVHIEATYAYQDGQWVFKDARRYINGDRNDEADDVAWVRGLFS